MKKVSIEIEPVVKLSCLVIDCIYNGADRPDGGCWCNLKHVSNDKTGMCEQKVMREGKEYIPKDLFPPNYVEEYFYAEACEYCTACRVVMVQRKNFCNRYKMMVDCAGGHCDSFKDINKS